MATDNITVVDVGEKIALPAWRRRVVVKASCGGSVGFWYCATHREGFKSNLAKDAHTDNRQTHALAWVCGEHGPERP